MLILILFLNTIILGQKKDCELCDLIEYQNSYDNDPMFYNRTKFNWTTDELRSKINRTLINQLKIDVETIKQNKELAKILPIDELKKAVTIWNKMKLQEQADKIREIRVPSYIPVPVYSVYQIPILHHFPVEQLSRTFKPVPFGIPMENQIIKYHHNATEFIKEKVVNPATIPYDVKVPIPTALPMETNEEEQKNPPNFISYLKNQFDNTNDKTINIEEQKKPNLIGNLKKQFMEMLN